MRASRAAGPIASPDSLPLRCAAVTTVCGAPSISLKYRFSPSRPAAPVIVRARAANQEDFG
ncbi:hypothetical protein CO2235_70048 [Cupriavidus oxalaticus]|uniref:Uncharacterized protein n=1 Tax=Cupriavidus oxalaticus TaxID=96344 RepID=A0A375GAH6_9BURK|nr:hypothetical protein CO2235_70048 [Cupriavidus oxalaticus]